jgi:hypothetical protein
LGVEFVKQVCPEAQPVEGVTQAQCWLPLQVWPVGQGAVLQVQLPERLPETPALRQLSPDPQAVPQPPQLLSSVWVSRQRFELAWFVPLPQHHWPLEPQLRWLQLPSSQSAKPLQSLSIPSSQVVSAGKVVWHWPSTHLPPVQRVTQSGLLVVLQLKPLQVEAVWQEFGVQV